MYVPEISLILLEDRYRRKYYFLDINVKYLSHISVRRYIYQMPYILLIWDISILTELADRSMLDQALETNLCWEAVYARACSLLNTWNILSHSVLWKLYICFRWSLAFCLLSFQDVLIHLTIYGNRSKITYWIANRADHDQTA